MMFRIVVVACLLGSFALQGEVNESTAVIEAGGLSLTKAEFEQLLKGDVRYKLALTEPATKRAFGTEFGKAFASEAEARRRKIDQSPAIQLKIKNYTQQLLAHELLVNLREGFLKDQAALTSHYEKRKQFFSQPHVRQIMVRSSRAGKERPLEEARALANAWRTKLAAGADFATLAKAESEDPGSREKGGDLGFIARGNTAAKFEDVAYSLPVGKLSEVVQTDYGFHLLLVEDRRPMPLESVKAAIANELAHQEMDTLLLNSYKLNEAYFGK